MVLQQTIDNLKERPHHERRAVALFVALGVMAVLVIVWAIFFFSGIRSQGQAQSKAQEQAQQQQAAAQQAQAAADQQAQDEASSSSDGYIDTTPQY